MAGTPTTSHCCPEYTDLCGVSICDLLDTGLTSSTDGKDYTFEFERGGRSIIKTTTPNIGDAVTVSLEGLNENAGYLLHVTTPQGAVLCYKFHTKLTTQI